VDDDLNDIPRLGRSGTTSKSSGIAEYPENIRQMWSDYYATVTFMDEQLGKVMAELDRQGLRESTLVIFTSDHGYHLGEHHMWQKSTFHEEVTRVPLLVSAPGFQQGRSMALAELMDLYPTVCDLLELPIPQSVQGRSLKPILIKPEATIHDAAFSLDPRKGHAIRTTNWAYMRYRDGSEELYDMKADPGQFTNLADKPGWKEQKAKLIKLMNQKLIQLKK
jgi:iduronate 2-sulfatase